MSNKLSNPGNKLKTYNVTIGEVELIKESILSIEISYKNYTPVVLAKVVIDDLVDLNLQQEWDDLTVQIYYMDIYEEFVNKNFTVLDIKEIHDKSKNKKMIIELQDTFSYKLEHSFLSKSFYDDPVSALNEYITYLELDTDINETLDFSDLTDQYYFTIPKNVSNLDWFLFELNKHGYSFYQTKNTIAIKSLNDLIPSGLEENDELSFTNETDNQLYKNKIQEMQTTFLKRKDVLPKTKTLSFNSETKTMDFSEENDNSDYDLSSGDFNFQTNESNEKAGTQYTNQQHLNFDEHIKKMKESYLSAHSNEIIVNGFIKNDLNQLFKLELKGNSSTAESQSKGNLILNGNYVSYVVIDKIAGDSFSQKVFLHRSDLTTI